eukprot:2624445-Rhodomonas_salina.2
MLLSLALPRHGCRLMRSTCPALHPEIQNKKPQFHCKMYQGCGGFLLPRITPEPFSRADTAAPTAGGQKRGGGGQKRGLGGLRRADRAAPEHASARRE